MLVYSYKLLKYMKMNPSHICLLDSLMMQDLGSTNVIKNLHTI